MFCKFPENLISKNNSADFLFNCCCRFKNYILEMFITKFKTHSFNFTASITMTALLFSGTEKESRFYTKAEVTLHRNNLAPVSDVSVYFADVSQYPKEKKTSRYKHSRKKYISGSQISRKSNSASSATPTLYLATKYDHTNIRTKPHMSAEVIANLKQGTKLIVLSREVSWYKVKVHGTGKVGYIHRYMVK